LTAGAPGDGQIAALPIIPKAKLQAWDRTRPVRAVAGGAALGIIGYLPFAPSVLPLPLSLAAGLKISSWRSPGKKKPGLFRNTLFLLFFLNANRRVFAVVVLYVIDQMRFGTPVRSASLGTSASALSSSQCRASRRALPQWKRRRSLRVTSSPKAARRTASSPKMVRRLRAPPFSSAALCAPRTRHLGGRRGLP